MSIPTSKTVEFKDAKSNSPQQSSGFSRRKYRRAKKAKKPRTGSEVSLLPLGEEDVHRLQRDATRSGIPPECSGGRSLSPAIQSLRSPSGISDSKKHSPADFTSVKLNRKDEKRSHSPELIRIPSSILQHFELTPEQFAKHQYPCGVCECQYCIVLMALHLSPETLKKIREIHELILTQYLSSLF